VRFIRTGCLPVLENLVMFCLLSRRLAPGQRTRRTGVADSNGRPEGRYQKKSRPTQLTGDNRIGKWLRGQASTTEGFEPALTAF
jgi:hypothetical protein